ncbi:MAG: flagellar biosynthesis repressor FlbT [Rhodospirillaceae bacterium]|jgi:flagellar protein FlbT|nr:flagellar biosynthesis repressor FlbT [Rhodospirillaceae bacterium]MBT4046406.1 flagellar biosynthesis repressor FlbT [Rhodospirillaceae bacterium]MBT4691296.1 flagellar biosynthesis repressor FlbT [Rhodospirillaceae bacterium]MBT5081128.1 flagellar biosynthesis repressor FlbT [Rhodospirillaceae bacterium]MBT5524655.1 flagellar biosynthesis repressor FlbT [Rhodospirillaceae bacterium]
MALKLTLKPSEKFIINGAVVQNSDRRTTLVIQNRASLLREKDIMLPEDATTPMRRVYFTIMLLYLDEGSVKENQDNFLELMTSFMNAISNAEAVAQCVNVIQLVHSKQYYKGLVGCRKLFPFEEERLSYVAS